MERREEIYPNLERQTLRLTGEVNAFLAKEGIEARLRGAGSMFHLPFQSGPIGSARDVHGEHSRIENRFYLHLLRRGVLVPGIHLAFLSAAHTGEDVDRIIDAYVHSFEDLRAAGERW